MSTDQSNRLDGSLGKETLAIGDLILAEVLQGFSAGRDLSQAQRLMTSFPIVDIGVGP